MVRVIVREKYAAWRSEIEETELLQLILLLNFILCFRDSNDQFVVDISVFSWQSKDKLK